MNNDMTVSQMLWQPALLRLTAAPHPDINNGSANELCFVAPQQIVSIERRPLKWAKMEVPDEKWPTQIATCISVSSHLYYYVIEPPEVVAAMRDRALGHEPKPREV